MVADLAAAEQQLHDLGASVQEQQEKVNRAIAETEVARKASATAEFEVAARLQALCDADRSLAAAQHRFDQFAASTYTNGTSESYLTAAKPEDLLDTASDSQMLAQAFTQAEDQLKRTRTARTNDVSAAKAAQKQADENSAIASQSKLKAVAELTEAQREFHTLQNRIDLAVERRDIARRRLAAATKRTATWDTAPATAASEWDLTLPRVPSANVIGDPAAIVESVLQATVTSTQLTADLGRSFLAHIGINLGGVSGVGGTGITNGAIPRVYGRQASEYVIRRAMSQIGVPYSWGGGNAAGPSRGIDNGAGTVGFDCSGIVLFAYAGVGINLPHYSGDQYNAGRKIPSSQMRRGDLIFYGPNASQHEAVYLGQGMMLEAPYTGSDVHISPVRSAGMTPYVTRLIEY